MVSGMQINQKWQSGAAWKPKSWSSEHGEISSSNSGTNASLTWFFLPKDLGCALSSLILAQVWCFCIPIHFFINSLIHLSCITKSDFYCLQPISNGVTVLELPERSRSAKKNWETRDCTATPVSTEMVRWVSGYAFPRGKAKHILVSHLLESSFQGKHAFGWKSDHFYEGHERFIMLVLF